MQIAYFDESGIDGAHDITLIAGFAARLQDWPKIVGAWKTQLQADRVPFFHYIDCKNQTGPYKGWNWHQDCLPHLRRMANILITSPIGGVSAASLGNWKESIRQRSDLRDRFPSAYSFCFEMLMQKIRQEMNFHGQPDITMIFADQREYKRRALEVWEWHRERDAWPEIKDIRYAEPKDVIGLQMADMLAWETRRHLHKKGEEWRSLPLLSRLIPKQAETGTALYEIAYNDKGLSEIKRATERFLK